MDVNMSVSLTEPDFKATVVLHCLQKAGSTDQLKEQQPLAVSIRGVFKLSPQLDVLSALLVLYLMERMAEFTIDQHITDDLRSQEFRDS